jgi:hypothetical protein
MSEAWEYPEHKQFERLEEILNRKYRKKND